MSGLSSANVPPPPTLLASSVPPPPRPNANATQVTAASLLAQTTNIAAATTTATSSSMVAANPRARKTANDELNDVDDDDDANDGTMPTETNKNELLALQAAANGPTNDNFAHDPVVREAMLASSAATAAAAASVVGGNGAVDRTKHPSGIVPTLQNIVSTVNLGCTLDLKSIALHARNAEYNPKRFSAVIMRIREPKTTALIFASGKMVCTGAKSEDDSKLAARKYARIIQKLGFEVRFLEFKVQNIVASVDAGFPIRLESLAQTHSKYSSYEPELFPGLIYRLLKPKVVLLIFVSGKVVLTGAKSRDNVYEAFELVYNVLRTFRKQPVPQAIAAPK